jgi:hypothetical protein
MPKHLFSLNVVLGAIAACFAAYIAWEVIRPGPPVASGARPKSGAPAAVATLPSPPPAEPASSWSVISSRNPFSPSRSEAPATAVQVGAAAANIPRPNLYGIVLKDNAPFAYIEDPQTKRVAAYRIGDVVAGGTLEKIARDGIVLTRPEGAIDVRLHDPNKPRPALPSPPTAAVPAGTPAPAPMPGVIPPTAAQQQQPPPPAEAPPQPPAATQSGEQQQQPPAAQRPPVRRPLPPNLLRRLPQTPPGDDQSR